MTFFLLPNLFCDEQSPHGLLPIGIEEVVGGLDGLIAESERSGRRYLMKLLHRSEKARQMPIFLLNEHANIATIEEVGSRIVAGEKWGLVSDAGLPIIADPGSLLVAWLRKQGFSDIVAIPGPSSIVLALMVSGFCGQKYLFHGYLPKERGERLQVLRQIERSAIPTHIFIETPYRNHSLFEDCLAVLPGDVQLCLATALTLPQQQVEVHPVRVWKTIRPQVPKEPTVFLMYNPS